MSKFFDAKTNKEVIQQIRPHYIFNVLWNIQYLIKHDPKNAEKLTTDFSTYLRGKINDLCYEGLTPFSQELLASKSYLELERVRSSDSIKTKYEIEFDSFDIPNLVLQPIVENAIKHGIYANDNIGTVTISSKKVDDYVVITVEDDGAGFDVGSLNKDECGNLFDLEPRLQKYYPEGKVSINSTIGKGTKVEIKFLAR